MVKIKLYESQLLAMKAEIKKMEEAFERQRPGILLFQVWPGLKEMEGKFVPEEIAVKIIKERP